MRVTCLVLASGSSRRFGSQKLLAALVNDDPLIVTTVKRCMSVFDDVRVILPENDTEIRPPLAAMPVEIVPNRYPHKGISESIKAGVKSVHLAESTAYLIVLADMPCVKTDTLSQLKAALSGEVNGGVSSARHRIVAPYYNSIRGNPVGFDSAFREQLLRLEGDVGAKSVVEKNKQSLVKIDVEDAGVLIDIDDQASLKKAVDQYQVDGLP